MKLQTLLKFLKNKINKPTKTKIMKQETLDAAKKALAENSICALFTSAIGKEPEDVEENDVISYALMFNVETDELFFLSYATPENSWAKTAEGQNPWILLGYVSATDILMGDPAAYISEKLDYEFEQQQLDSLYNQ